MVLYIIPIHTNASNQTAFKNQLKYDNRTNPKGSDNFGLSAQTHSVQI